MELILYPVLVILASLIFYLISRRKSILKANKLIIESNRKLFDSITESQFRWVVIVVMDGEISKSFEDDDLGKVGFHIYSNYSKSINQLKVYIKDNEEDKLMKIVTNGECESMIGVDDADGSHIGYLSFEYVDKIN